MRSFTSCSPIFNPTITKRVAAENVSEYDAFQTFSIATQSVFVASEIGKREENLRMIFHKFRIHYFVL